MERIVREKFEKLVNLTRGMARMGAFDDLVRHRLKHKTPPQPRFYRIDLDNLKGDDAREIVIAGLHSEDIPNLSFYRDGTWSKRTAEEQHEELLFRATVRGLVLFKKELRNNMGDGDVKVPAKPRNT
jgi:hypothetical protein